MQGACRLLLLAVLASGAAEYDVLVLLPLTGPRQHYGRALLSGVQRALPETANRTHAGASVIISGNDGATVNVNIFYANTEVRIVRLKNRTVDLKRQNVMINHDLM